MVCKETLFSDHAINQMFKRDISVDDVKIVIEAGEIITSYLYDKPYPSYLILFTIKNRPIHVVVAKEDMADKCIVVTTYEPDISIWNADFKSKKQ